MQNPDQLRALLAMAGVAGIAFLVVVGLAVAVAICWFLYTCLARVPVQYRQQEPVMVWLLLIPCFNLVWNFFVYPKIAESYKAYFDSVGRTDVGDCGRSLAVTFCILAVVGIPLGIVPFIGGIISCFLGLANLVIWILFMVKAVTLKGQIPLDAGTVVTPAPPPSQP
ncbi:MAG: hypothetical protein A3K19_31835 [Lentisphaerae bacterium RIFOXYB12_FULL_65_16]|nr:MAG: hypothetical protein A3K18_10615 [Lentisphaerae bacterium RIFOXYA12_64_32]OGV88692.1 MAG: hypothetical protein A3K19_31835 [Lentisphaerae bacterium RIFOXYB12_FULL_65_16]